MPGTLRPIGIQGKSFLSPILAGGYLELFEAKWTELSSAADTVNLGFVRNIVGRSRTRGGGIICRSPNNYPLPNGFRALSMTDLV